MKQQILKRYQIIGESIAKSRNESKDAKYRFQCDVEMQTIRQCGRLIANCFDVNTDGRYDIIKLMMDAYNMQVYAPDDEKEQIRFRAITNAAGACMGALRLC